MCPLEVDPFARGICGQQHLYRWVVEESLLRLGGGSSRARLTVNDDYRLRISKQRGDAVLQILERVAVLGEEHQFLPVGEGTGRGISPLP